MKLNKKTKSTNRVLWLRTCRPGRCTFQINSNGIVKLVNRRVAFIGLKIQSNFISITAHKQNSFRMFTSIRYHFEFFIVAIFFFLLLTVMLTHHP